MSRPSQKALDLLWLAEPDSDEGAKRKHRCHIVHASYHPRVLRCKAKELARRGYLHLPPNGEPCRAWLTPKGRSALWQARNLGYRPVSQ